MKSMKRKKKLQTSQVIFIEHVISSALLGCVVTYVLDVSALHHHPTVTINTLTCTSSFHFPTSRL